MASGSEAEDQMRLATGYNRSIYLMLIVPYGALAIMGNFVNRQIRLDDAAHGKGTLVNENESVESRIREGAR